jgi:hypothetical protein
VNVGKSYITGRTKGGKDIPDDLNMEWEPGKYIRKKKVTHAQSTRYLGCHLAMDLNWTTQIGKMNGMIMGITTVIRSGQVTLVQARYIIKEVLGGQLHIGMRHAEIPIPRLDQWDKWLNRALLRCADMSGTNLHTSVVATILKIDTTKDQNNTAKTMQLLDNVIKRSELKPSYKNLMRAASEAVYG